MLCERRDKSAATSFLSKAIKDNNIPDRVVVDKSYSNQLALDALNKALDQDCKTNT